MIKKLTQFVVFRYIVSGGTSASVDLFLLYVCNSLLHIHYLLAATLAFIGAFFVSFGLQKFWTFRHRSTNRIQRQAFMYLGTSLVGLGLNTLFMYFFVGHIGLPVLLAQICAGGLVACFTFFLSRNIVFKHEAPHLYPESR